MRLQQIGFMNSQPIQNAASNLGQTRVEALGKTARIDWVDKAKGICIILVVMMHTTLGLERELGSIGWMHSVVEFAKPFRMPDFFLISGLFLAATIDRPWRLYLDRKVLHFFYFYVLWVVIQFAFKMPFMIADGMTPAMAVRLLLFTFIQPFGTLWFIYMLPIFFVLTKVYRTLPWALFTTAVILQILPIDTTVLFGQLASVLNVEPFENYWVLIEEFCSFYVYFLAGYLFAPWIFKIASYARDNVIHAAFGVAVWFFVNLIFVTTGLAGLPIVSLILGGMGAIAIVMIAALLTRKGGTALLSHLGANSIVVYLAFFLPMVISRLVLLKVAPQIDPGTAAALCTTFGLITPLIGYAIIKRIGLGMFLFHRPGWAIIADKPASTKAVMHAAE